MENSINNAKRHDPEHLAKRLENYFSVSLKYIENLEDDDVDELICYSKFIEKGHITPHPMDLDTIKIFFSLMRLSHGDTEKIVSFLESTGYGWQDNKYALSNPCLKWNPTDHCKRMSPTSDPKVAYTEVGRLGHILFHEEYGQLALFLFCYCLAALFSKRLNSEQFPIPFYLQIACDRRSTLFQLIEEIAEICDVNSGLMDCCSTTTSRQCGYRSQIYYPTQSVTADLGALIRENCDTPVIVDGFENATYYNSLLRAVANIPNSRTAIDLRDKFNALPVFVCPVIKSSFGNVIDMDLSDFDINTEYLNYVREHKRLLASHVLELIKDSDSYLFTDKNEWYRSKSQPFKDQITVHMQSIRKQYPDLTLTNAKNISFLSFFFKGFLNVFQRSFQFQDPLYYQQDIPVTKEKYIEFCIGYAQNSLAELHLRYLPAPYGEGIQNKEAIQLARRIEKHYTALHTSIRVTPISVKDDRYIFRVETLQETKDSDVIGKKDTVQRRLKKYECFRFDMTDQREIKLIVAESQLQDNSLLKILQDTAFTDPKKKLPYAMGIDETGQPYIEDIVELTHLLLGGSTNSGKSTAIRSILLSIAYRHQSGDAYVIIMDLLSNTDESEFSVFNGHPIMACPVIQDPLKAAKTIFALHNLMKNRPRDRPASEVPYIICVIDEFPTLYNDLGKETVGEIQKAMSALLSKGRHANIHLVLAAQDPSKKDVGEVANAKTRIAFYCSHFRYSTNIIGTGDAAKLQGKGQMIFYSQFVRDKRLLGAYIDEDGMKKLVNDTKMSFRQKNPHHVFLPDTETIDALSSDTSLTANMNISVPPKGSRFKTFDELLPDAIIWTLSQEKVANSRLLKYLHVRDAMGKQILEWMAEHNLITRLNGNHGWEVKVRHYEELDETVLSILLNAGHIEDKIKAELAKQGNAV